MLVFTVALCRTANQVAINRRMSEQSVVYPCNEAAFSTGKERRSLTYYNIDESCKNSCAKDTNALFCSL